MPLLDFAEGDLASEPSTSEPEDDGSDADELLAEPQAAAPANGGTSVQSSAARLKISLKKDTSTLTCHVCGQTGHKAGFVGSVYFDCPNKACYLCKQQGHTTLTCPYRQAPGLGCTATRASTAAASTIGMLHARETTGISGAEHVPCKSPRWQVEAAILKVHSRRCCSLEFHPRNDSLVLSGDKKGQVAIWDFDKVHERTAYMIHHAVILEMASLPWSEDGMGFAATSISGSLKTFDCETGTQDELINLNPLGWHATGKKNWRSLHGLAACPERKALLVGDDHGVMHIVDPRRRGHVASAQVHRRGNKIFSIDAHPLAGDLVMTASGDHSVRHLDLRVLSSNTYDGIEPNTGARGKNEAHTSQVALMEHPRVVNAARFSPITGHKVLTTCQDNRLRVWDLLTRCNQPPDREIVHSHDFNRYLTPFRAEWDPKDPTESLIACGRYISEDYGGTALHPIDLMSASDGALVQQLVDANLTTISPVNKFHPRRDIIVSGSSRSLFAWAPCQDQEGPEAASASVPPGSTGEASTSAAAAAAAAMRRAALQSQSFAAFDCDPGSGGKGAGKGGGKKRKQEDSDSDG